MTPTLRFAAALLGATLAVVPVVACDRSPGGTATGGATADGPEPTTGPSPSISPSPTAPPTDPAIVFAADGIGDYVVGTSMGDLQARALITDVAESPHCSDAYGAKGTGKYNSTISLTFRSGRLTAIHTDSETLVTPSGAKVGMALTDLQGLYASRGTLINGSLGNKAFSVRVPASPLAVVFYLDSTNTKVAAMSGGEAQALEDAARNGEGC